MAAAGGTVSGRAPVAVAIFVAGLLVGILLPVELMTPGTVAPGASVDRSATPTLATVLEPPGDLPRVNLGDLPPQAATTIDLIETGGPFPFRQDGATFENREGLLPSRPEAHYREYTVARPGNQGRGSLRIVAGADGELYWTADHYDSFAWIVP